MDRAEIILGLLLLFMAVGTLGVIVWLCATMGY